MEALVNASETNTLTDADTIEYAALAIGKGKIFYAGRHDGAPPNPARLYSQDVAGIAREPTSQAQYGKAIGLAVDTPFTGKVKVAK